MSLCKKHMLQDGGWPRLTFEQRLVLKRLLFALAEDVLRYVVCVSSCISLLFRDANGCYYSLQPWVKYTEGVLNEGEPTPEQPVASGSGFRSQGKKST